MKKYSTHQSGFTVLEFLVVLFIMTILIGIILAGFGGARERSRDDMRITGIQNVALSLEQYYAACRSFPATLDWDEDQTCRQGGERKLSDFGSKPPLPDDEEFLYRAYSDSTSGGSLMGGSSNPLCAYYHLGIQLEDEDHGILDESVNLDSSATTVYLPSGNQSQQLYSCDDTNNGFNGDASGVYDIFR